MYIDDFRDYIDEKAINKFLSLHDISESSKNTTLDSKRHVKELVTRCGKYLDGLQQMTLTILMDMYQLQGMDPKSPEPLTNYIAAHKSPKEILELAIKDVDDS